MKKVSLHTLGCKLNYAEGETLLRTCEQQGYEIVDFDKPADLVLINTCSVTEQADQKCRAAVTKAFRANPSATLVVTGCYAQLKPQQIATMPGVQHVVGTEAKFDFFSDLEASLAGSKVQVTPIEGAKTFHSAHSFRTRTRAFLKVQDGCDYNCSFCTIPLARGVSRSAPIVKLREQLNEFVKNNVQEVVLSGVNVGDFGSKEDKIDGKGLLHLLRALDEVPSKLHFRISSIEPNLLSEDILSFVAEHSRWMPHFHIPLQSGSDKILAKMRRRYKRSLYASKIASIKRQMPDACIGADVIVGFPGETQHDFRETYAFLQDLEVNYLHVFPYAQRPNTSAAEMLLDLAPDTRKMRAMQLRNLSFRKQQAFYRSQIGKTRPLLLEQEERAGFRLGFTDNYVRAGLPTDSPARAGTRHQVRLAEIDDGFMRASLQDTHLTSSTESP